MLAWFESVGDQFYKNFIYQDRWRLYMEGLGNTLLIAAGAAVLGIILGIIIALMRLSKSRLLNGIASFYVNLIRGTPIVLQLLIMYFIVMMSYRGPAAVVAILTFGLNSGAYVSEMVRGGILAVDKGQTEAGRSLGLSAGATMRLIVLPQMFKITLPSLLNEFIMLLKETAVVGYIGLRDLTKAGDQVRGITYSPYMPLLVVAAIYLLIVTLLTYIFGRIERKVRESDLR
ncbi:MAG: amino acid ABC transporter permease [Clostridiales bacterium]|nr:amino acid ABC transporter permease [Clostridiales bacterium]